MGNEGDRGLVDNVQSCLSRFGRGVVTSEEMKLRLRLSQDKAHSLVITPHPTEFDTEAFDVRLGSHFIIPRGHRTALFCPGLTATDRLYDESYVPFGEHLILPAHHTVLGATLEYIKLPIDMSGLVLTKSSWARTFITVEAAAWIHPLYRGCLTLEIANVSNTPIVLYPGYPIAQIVLLHNARPENGAVADPDVKDKMSGTYVGPVRPEPGDIKSPEMVLGRMGIAPDAITYPYDENWAHIQNIMRSRGEHARVISQALKILDDGNHLKATPEHLLPQVLEQLSQMT